MLSKEDKQFMELYSDSEYEKPSVTVDAVVFRLTDKKEDNYRKLPEKKLQVYLTKRAYSPYKNKYSIIGTFIDLKSELNESMKLCVNKKIALKENYYYEQLFTFGSPNRDPRNRVISVSYMLLTNQETVVENGEWFDVDLTSEVVKNEKIASIPVMLLRNLPAILVCALIGIINEAYFEIGLVIFAILVSSGFMIFTKKNLAVHDFVAGTSVITIEKYQEIINENKWSNKNRTC